MDTDIHTAQVEVCYRFIHDRRCNTYCRYNKGHNATEYVDIDEGNLSRIPCRFLLKETGCLAKGESNHNINWRTGELLAPLCSDKFYEQCKHNHFYKPKYVCPTHFYNTSLGENDKCKKITNCDGKCGKLHIGWDNFVRNMFNSVVDREDKSRSMNFVANMTYAVSMQTEHGQNILDLMNSWNTTFKRNIKYLNSAYNTKCTICDLPPHKPKLRKPKTQSIWFLQDGTKTRELPDDVIRYILGYLYPQHECFFLTPTEPTTYTSVKSMEILRPTNIFGFGPRLVSYSSHRYVSICKDNSIRLSTREDLDDLDQLVRDSILRVLIDSS